jgi:hypothetical protein
LMSIFKKLYKNVKMKLRDNICIKPFKKLDNNKSSKGLL